MLISKIKDNITLDILEKYRVKNECLVFDESYYDQFIKDNDDILSIDSLNIQKIIYNNLSNSNYVISIVSVFFYKDQVHDDFVVSLINDDTYIYKDYKTINIIEVELFNDENLHLSKFKFNTDIYNDLSLKNNSFNKKIYVTTTGYTNSYILNKDQNFALDFISRVIPEDKIRKYKKDKFSQSNESLYYTSNSFININWEANNLFNTNHYFSNLSGRYKDLTIITQKYNIRINDKYVDDNIKNIYDLACFFISMTLVLESDYIKFSINKNVVQLSDLLESEQVLKTFNDYIKMYILDVYINFKTLEPKTLNSYMESFIIQSDIGYNELYFFKNNTKGISHSTSNSEESVVRQAFRFYNLQLYNKNNNRSIFLKNYVFLKDVDFNKDYLYINQEKADKLWSEHFKKLKIIINDTHKEEAFFYDNFFLQISYSDFIEFLKNYKNYYIKIKAPKSLIKNLKNLIEQFSALIDKNDNYIFFHNELSWQITPVVLENINNFLLASMSQTHKYLADDISIDLDKVIIKNPNKLGPPYQKLPLDIKTDFETMTDNRVNPSNNFNFGLFINNAKIDTFYLLMIYVDNFFEDLVFSFIPSKVRDSMTSAEKKDLILTIQQKEKNKYIELAKRYNIKEYVKFNEGIYNVLWVIYNRKNLDPDRYLIFLFDKSLISLTSINMPLGKIELADIIVYDKKHNNVFLCHNKFFTSSIHHISNQINVSSAILNELFNILEMPNASLRENEIIDNIFNIIYKSNYNKKYLLSKMQCKKEINDKNDVDQYKHLQNIYLNKIDSLLKSNITIIAGIGIGSYYSCIIDESVKYKDGLSDDWNNWSEIEEKKKEWNFLTPLTSFSLWDTHIKYSSFKYVIKRIPTIKDLWV